MSITPRRQSAIRLALLLVLAFAWVNGSASPEGSAQRTPFWLGIRASQQLDVQVQRLIADHGAIAVLRFFRDDPISGSAGPQRIAELKALAPDLPILIYGWVSRYFERGCTGDQAMRWLAGEPELQLPGGPPKARSLFGDVRSCRYRQKTVSNIRTVVERYGADGIGIDLALRTPALRPAHLARRCASEIEFCGDYADGMDSLFDGLQDALGKRLVLFNGLWTFTPDTLADQERLLTHADGAIVEYFGKDPNLDDVSFARDLLPYLDAMDRLAPEKRLYVYGRGSWDYEDYEDDYLHQRYLFAAYLLAARANTAFKYQSSFQVPAHQGRSGGLDLYADSLIPLGEPQGIRTETAGLLSRTYTRGLVLVSPQGGAGGTFTPERPMFTPEGTRLAGPISVAPGSALILLDSEPPPAQERTSIPLQPLVDWSGARWHDEPRGPGYLELDTIADPGLVGDHDLLLDTLRTLEPYSWLKLRVRALNRKSRLLAVAEVDDPGRRTTLVVACIEAAGAESCGESIDAPYFRLPTGVRKGHWPAVAGPRFKVRQWTDLKLDGPELFAGTGYRFRRWAHLRAEGAWQLARAALGREGRDD